MWKKQFKFLVISIALISINAFFACRDNDFGNKTSFQFEDVTRQAGFEYEHGLTEESFERDIIAGGVAAGDLDADGFIDLYAIRGDIGRNLLFHNEGDGTFEDVTEEAGVRHGFWGWGSCSADFNNDGNPDIFHVNGFGFEEGEENALEFLEDASRLFNSNGDGTFTEMATELGIDDTRQGRGTVCFDYDRDGDVDIFIANYSESPRLYRNEGGNNLNFLNIKLVGITPNTDAIGARTSLTIEDKTQTREIRSGNNFESQNPAEAHFGLNKAKLIDEIRIRWPDVEITILEEVEANQFLKISHPLLIIE